MLWKSKANARQSGGNTSAEGCANLFWRISPHSDLVRPVLASHPAMANSICRAYFSPTLLSSLVLPPPWHHAQMGNGQARDLFDVLLRKKSAFHKRAVFATRADRQSVPLKYQRAHWEACHGGVLLWCLTSFLRANTKTGYTHNSSVSVRYSGTVAQIDMSFPLSLSNVLFSKHAFALKGSGCVFSTCNYVIR